MGVIREQSEKMFTGAITTRQFHPLLPTGEYEEIAAGVMFYRWFANVTAAKTREGLVLIDTGGYFNQDATVKLIRRFSPDRVNTAIYTHGHVKPPGGARRTPLGFAGSGGAAAQQHGGSPARRGASRDRGALRSLQAHRWL